MLDIRSLDLIHLKVVILYTFTYLPLFLPNHQVPHVSNTAVMLSYLCIH